MYTSTPDLNNCQSGPCPLFIIGSPRSGTTFLTRMDNKFLDIHLVRDAGVVLRFYELLSKYGNLTIRKNMKNLIKDLFKDHFFKKRIIKRGFTLSSNQLLEKLPQSDYPSLIDCILTETAKTHGKKSWGIKKPSYALTSASIDTLFPNAKFLHIIRDGRDVALHASNKRHHTGTQLALCGKGLENTRNKGPAT